MSYDKDKVKIIILAAGLGKRMKSEHPKVLLPLGGRPIIHHIRDSVLQVHGENPIAVIGHQAELVQEKLGDSFVYVIQEDQLGTGHAVAMAQKACGDAENIVVLYGDQPFIKSETIKNIIDKHTKSGAKITFATTQVSNYDGEYKVFWTFARILRVNGAIVDIRDYRDASDEEKKIKEVNAGCYVFNAKWLWENLKKINKENIQGEYYLTDLLPIAFRDGEKVESINMDPREAMGANSKEELDILERLAVQ